ncbi:50S ribosomal protein L29 [bacterium]|nr:50S ribosomal protein L29 [candidate division CSSED10-310 bacterium]
MKASELLEMSVEEREVHLKGLYDELFKLRFKKTIGQLDNPTRIRIVRREIARVLTVNRSLALKAEQKDRGTGL